MGTVHDFIQNVKVANNFDAKYIFTCINICQLEAHGEGYGQVRSAQQESGPWSGFGSRLWGASLHLSGTYKTLWFFLEKYHTLHCSSLIESHSPGETQSNGYMADYEISIMLAQLLLTCMCGFIISKCLCIWVVEQEGCLISCCYL